MFNVINALYQSIVCWFAGSVSNVVTHADSGIGSTFINGESLNVAINSLMPNAAIAPYINANAINSAAVYLSMLPDQSIFSVSADDVPLFSAVNEAMPLLQSVSQGVTTYVPAIMLASIHPLLSGGWLLARHMPSLHAQDEVPALLAKELLDIKTELLNAKDVVKDVTEIYRARSLQNEADCQPGIHSSNTSFAFVFGGPYEDSVADIAVAPNGDVILAGTTKSASENQALLCRFNATGSLLWAKIMSGVTEATTIVLTQAGDIVWADYYGALVAKFNGTGGAQWVRRVSLEGYSQAIKKLKLTLNEELILAGNYYNASDSNNHAFLMKLNVTGGVLWAKGLRAETVAYFSANSLAIGASGDMFLTGNTNGFGVLATKIFLVRLTSIGNIVWAKLLGDTSANSGHDIVLTESGDIIIAGVVSSGMPMLSRLNALGDLQWVVTLGGINFVNAGRGITIALTNDSHLIASILRYDKTALFCLTLNGELQWSRYLNLKGWSSHTGSGWGSYESFSKIALTAQNDLLLARDTQSFGAGDYGDIFLVRLDANGLLDVPHVAEIHGNDSITLNSISLEALTVAPSVITMSGAMSAFSVLAPRDINTLVMRPLTLRVKLNNEIFNVAAYYQFRYAITTDDLFANLPLQAQAQITADVSALPWLHYDSEQQLLSGTFLSNAQSSYLVMVGVSARFGVFTDNILWNFPINFCVKSYDANIPTYFHYAVNPQQTARFNQFYQFDFSMLLFPEASVATIAGDAALRFPDWLSFNANTNLLTGTPVGSVRGDYLMKITFSINAELADTLSFVFTVPNTAPYFIANSEFNVTVGAFETLLTRYFVDDEADSMRANLAELFYQALPFSAQVNGVTGQLYGTLVAGQQGSYIINITGTDAYQSTGWGLLAFNVINRSPMLVHPLGNALVSENNFLSYYIDDAFTDPDGDTLTYHATLPEFLMFDATTKRLSGHVPQAIYRGNNIVSFTVSDPFGGSVSTLMYVTVNAVPIQAINMGTWVTSKVGVPYRYRLPDGLFTDPEGGSVSYTLLDSPQKPQWLSFNELTNELYGIPDSNYHQTFSIRLNVSDYQGGYVVFNALLRVNNSEPIPEWRIANQRVSQAETFFGFTAPAFFDPDGDAVSYAAYLHGGIALPTWMQFNPQARRFSGDPSEAVAGDYLLDLVATDSYELSQTATFSLSIQPANLPTHTALPIPIWPALAEKSTITSRLFKTFMDYLLPIVSSMLMIGLISIVALIRRQRRIRSTTEKLKEIARSCYSEADNAGTVTFDAILDHLALMQSKISSTASISAEIELYMHYLEQITVSYYQHNKQSLPITRLYSTGIVQHVINFMNEHLLVLAAGERNVSELLKGAKLLHRLFFLLLIEHAALQRRMPSKMKWEFFHLVDNLLERLPKKSIYDTRVIHEMLSVRESLIYLPETDTLGMRLKQCGRHLILIPLLLKDIKNLFIDIPAVWYGLLLEAWQWLEPAKTNITALWALQAMASKNVDWRFQFGLANVLLTILFDSTSADIKASVISGKQSGRKVTHLGLLHLVKRGGTCWRKSNVAQHVICGLKEREHELGEMEKVLLAKYVIFSNSASLLSPSLLSPIRVSQHSQSNRTEQRHVQHDETEQQLSRRVVVV